MGREVEEMRVWLHSLLDLPVDGTLVDLGCGDGDDLASLARERPDAIHTGVDRWEAGIAKARSLHKAPNLEYLCADASGRLPFADASLDAVYSVNLLECLPDKPAFVAECARILKPGGSIVIGHFDWDTQTFDGNDQESIRTIVQAFNDWQQAWMEDIDPWAGRRIHRYLTREGLFAGAMRAYPLLSASFEEGSYGRRQAESFEALVRRGAIGQSEYDAFFRFQQESDACGSFLYSVTMFAFVGRKL